jgi:tetratricopeptide (TPR) repeat protein
VIEDAKAAEKAQAERELLEWSQRGIGHLSPAVASVVSQEDFDPDKKALASSSSSSSSFSSTTSSSSLVSLSAPAISALPEASKENSPENYAQALRAHHIWSETDVTVGAAARAAAVAAHSTNSKSASAAFPPPRTTVTVPIAFTPKPNNMPAREALEDDPADADRLKDTVPDIASENDVVWLRDRGAHFFKHGDYIASVNAYTAALEFQSKNPQLLINRAAAHFQLMAFTGVIADCNRAVQLLEKRKSDGVAEMSTADAFSFGIALARRAAAQLRLGMITDALSDLQRALKLLPDDAALASDFLRVQELAQTSKVLPLKEAADNEFKKGEKETALVLYNSAIAEDGGCFQLYSNRAACLASMQRHADAIADCNKALLILDPKKDGGDTRLALRLLVRRGASFVSIGDVRKCHFVNLRHYFCYCSSHLFLMRICDVALRLLLLLS